MVYVDRVAKFYRLPSGAYHVFHVRVELAQGASGGGKASKNKVNKVSKVKDKGDKRPLTTITEWIDNVSDESNNPGGHARKKCRKEGEALSTNLEAQGYINVTVELGWHRVGMA